MARSRKGLIEANEAIAKARRLRISPRKLNLLASMIRGKSVSAALNELAFSKKAVSLDVIKCLQSAVANAENNHQLDVDTLIVAEAYVGKNITIKRMRPRARGATFPIRKPTSDLTIKVREQPEAKD